jgi:ribosomal protein S18 acetylase RimI-like enzyme
LEKVKASAGSRVLKLHVETTHDAAFRLYDTAGFRRVGTVPDYYGTGRHAISMELDPTND